MTDSEIKELASRLVGFLEETAKRQDKGAMADIRSAASKTAEYRSWKHLAQFGGIDTSYADIVRAVAWLYSVCPRNDSHAGNFGSIVRKIERARNKDNDGNDMRIRKLLACDRGDIAANVMKFGGYLKNTDIRIDFTNLFIDMFFWSDGVKMRWAEAYYNSANSGGKE